ncbi:MAG: type II toxin-antitoxin system VapC family toxin [Cytophagaceae bacterium]|nr:type II toxin-antitoxin system VapC family toxin [Cytophagaceae bacterium]
MTYFFDTSALFKKYRTEAGSAVALSLIDETSNECWISELARIKFFSALFRLHRSLLISDDDLELQSNHFDASLPRYQISLLSPDILAEAEFLLRTEGRRFPLRTLDSLHLATFRVVGDPAWTFVSTDDQLNAIAETLGHRVLNPLV